MSNLRNLIFLTACGALLAACSGPDIAMLKSMPNKGTVFDNGLQAGYTQLVADEGKEQDFGDADHFGKKATMAAKGQNVLPDRLFDRKAPKKYQAELQAGWQRLTLARTHGGKTKAPQQLATAQTIYDCWIQEAEEDIQRLDISRCQIGFNAAMVQVDAAMKEKKMAAPAPAKKAPTKESHIVYFSHDSAELAASSAIIINDAAASIKKGAKATFVIGHTDASGSDVYNQKLADRRSNAVIAALKKAGVKSGISKGVADERDPKVKTKDGERKGVNRRVEIAILR